MTTKRKSDRFHVELDMSALETDVAAREALITNIQKLGPSSPLWQSLPLQTAVGSLGTSFVVYKTAMAKAEQSGTQHKLDVTAEVDARNVNDKALLLVKALTELGATSVTDISSMAFTPLRPRPVAPALVPPDSIDIKVGKKGSGKARVAAHEIGPTKRSYAAEMSSDPIGPATWATLPGSGKSRRISGKSGTSVWVRFALMHGQLQSDWSAAVLVTFP